MNRICRTILLTLVLASLGLSACVRSMSTATSRIPTLSSEKLFSSPEAGQTQPTAGVAAQPASASTQVAQPELPTLSAPTFIPGPPTAIPSPTATASPMPPHTQSVNLYLIALADDGKSGKAVGCGDSVVAVEVPIEPTVGVLRAALTKLLEVKSQYYGQSGLYNSLYQSNLKIDKLYVQNGEAGIYLSGDLTLGGECDNPRVQAQIEATALQFSTVQRVVIYINNKPIESVLSGK